MVESTGAMVGAVLACNFMDIGGLGRIKDTTTLGGSTILGYI